MYDKNQENEVLIDKHALKMFCKINISYVIDKRVFKIFFCKSHFRKTFII